MLRLVKRTTIYGLLFGVLIAILNYLALRISNHNVPLEHALLAGVIFGSFFGILSSGILIMITNHSSYSLKSIHLSTVILSIIFSFFFLFLTPDMYFYIVNVLLATIASLYVMQYSINFTDIT